MAHEKVYTMAMDSTTSIIAANIIAASAKCQVSTTHQWCVAMVTPVVHMCMITLVWRVGMVTPAGTKL
jgi:hypothetical protein